MQKKSRDLKSKGSMTLDKLAGMVANGFSSLEEKLTKKIDGVENSLGSRIDSLENKFDSLENRIDTMEDRLTQKIAGIENRIDSLVDGKANRDEVKVINTRLTRVEKKLAI